MHFATGFLLATLPAAAHCLPEAEADIDVLTSMAVECAVSGAVLTPADVNSAQFGGILSFAVDRHVYAVANGRYSLGGGNASRVAVSQTLRFRRQS